MNVITIANCTARLTQLTAMRAGRLVACPSAGGFDFRRQEMSRLIDVMTSTVMRLQ